MAEGVLNATATHNPKDLIRVVSDTYGENGDSHNPQEASDFEDWSWESKVPNA